MEITFIMLGSLNHKSWWRSFVKTPMMMLSAYLLFGCKNILMLDATRSLLLKFCNRWCLVRQGGSDSPHLQCEQLWGEQTRHSLLTYYYKQNTQQQFSQPGITPCSPCLASPAPASSWKQRNEFIIHQKGSEQLDRGSHNIAISPPSICSPPSLAWEPSYNGQ